MNRLTLSSILASTVVITFVAVSTGQNFTQALSQKPSKSKKGFSSGNAKPSMYPKTLSKDQDVRAVLYTDAIRERAILGMTARAVAAGGLTIDVQVDWTQTLDANTQNLYQQMATTLYGASTNPADRSNYYSYYINSSTYTLNGYFGFVSNVTQMPNG